MKNDFVFFDIQSRNLIKKLMTIIINFKKLNNYDK